MSISWLISNFVSTFLLPPLNLLLLMVIGLVLWPRRPKLGRGLVTAGVVALWVLSTPLVGIILLRSLESPPVTAEAMKGAQAIIILGGGRLVEAPEYGEEAPGQESLLRLRYAAKLHRQSGLPILTTGGKPDGGELSEAEVMARSLERDFSVPVRWKEGASDNTGENAKNSARMLREAGMTRVLVVSNAWHLKRALPVFEREGLSAIAAPTGFQRSPLLPNDLLPSPGGLLASRWAFHEWIGQIWYRLRY
ncbi:MAG: YdcF family protein [Rhodocyclaceae bacterium]|nr:YdcF family protein [Rhodocyclaceae bacterium]